MSEILEIKNFGPIKDVRLELGRFNVLIGEQATGKSTVAKLLAICRYFSYIIGDGFKTQFHVGLADWGLSEYINFESYIHYECQHYSLTVKYVPIKQGPGIDARALSSTLNPLSTEFKSLLVELYDLVPEIQNSQSFPNPSFNIPVSFFKNSVSRIMDNPFFVPVERVLQSIFSLGKSSIRNMSDSLFNQFAELDQIVRAFNVETNIEPLGIVYINDNGKGYFKKELESKLLSVTSAASGYQSTIPVVLIAKYYNEYKQKAKTLIIEEPELNLFPNAQNRLVQYLVAQALHYGNSLFFTTHSPYILTSINNLLYAYQVGQRNSLATEKILSRQYWLNPTEVKAYMLLKDGTSKVIIEEELRQIDVGEIDSVSRSVNKIWDDLLNVEANGN